MGSLCIGGHGGPGEIRLGHGCGCSIVSVVLNFLKILYAHHVFVVVSKKKKQGWAKCYVKQQFM